MDNNRKTISANEINKYTYCPYQWYYERLYGRKYIRAKYKERNEKYGMEDSAASNFNKGLKHHRRYLALEKLKFIFRIVALIIILLFVIYLFYFFKGF